MNQIRYSSKEINGRGQQRNVGYKYQTQARLRLFPAKTNQMNALCSAPDLLYLQPFVPSPFLSSSFLHKTKPSFSPSLRFSTSVNLTRSLILNPSSSKPKRHGVCAAASDIELLKNKEGIWTAKQKKVVVLWDLDNKPPRGPPYQAAMALREVAERFGDIVDISAYANRHAFVHLPQWVLEERRERRQVDFLERKGLSSPTQPYVCGVCGRKCRTNLDLKKHFKQLHERERQKKLNRMRSLKGKKRQRYKERFVSGNHKYEEAARSLLAPRIGYGLASELRRAGVFVKTVEDKPQAADWALKRQMQHSMSRGIDWLFLVSDDSDFSEMLRRARASNLGTVVVGDWQRALGRHADLWVPWAEVENGEVGEKDFLSSNRRDDFSDRDGIMFSISHFDGTSDAENDLNQLVDEIAVTNSSFDELKISAFSEGEDEEEGWVTDEDHGHLGNHRQSLGDKDMLWFSDEDGDW